MAGTPPQGKRDHALGIGSASEFGDCSDAGGKGRAERHP
jgi:hypothetical protein